MHAASRFVSFLQVAIDRVSDRLKDLFERFLLRCIYAHRIDLHRICELISEVPCVQLLVVVVVAERRCAIERICEVEFLLEQLAGVQIEREANFGLQFRHRVDSVQHAAHDEHLADLLMVHADVEAVHDVQRCFIDLRHDRVVGFRCCMDDPQSVVVGVEVNHIVVRRVQILRDVDVLDWFAYWKNSC